MTRGTDYAEGAAEQAPQLWAARAAVAEQGVLARHLRRLWAIPGTRLGVATWPATPGDRLLLGWNYWWQAHLLDSLIDAQLRAPSPARLTTIRQHIRGVHVRNFGKWTNEYYDDIAWMGLALLRASDEFGFDTEKALDAITAQIREGWTDHGGGGIWWRRSDTLKNVPANGPAAILLARFAQDRADRQRARSMTDWMDEYLLDDTTGLVWDGLYVHSDGEVRERVEIVYSYCQGVFLGACVELAADDPTGEWTERAERTIKAVARHLAVDGVIPGRAGGDGGLFSGILARYLALSAIRLPEASADLAEWMVITTAEEAWRNRGVAPSGPLFGDEPIVPAITPRGRRDRRVERDLSVQLSGWMYMEAAALLEAHASMRS
ncbi:glycoside hydrolase family 76 protein [Actinokineospora sp. HUAS TT18]|uniref:glycoside hydrolase family 76 protein n=1 Tax=Actinokineospora sp. HUAS TT18 TaxID=3447451 RepID=UPI003F5271FC